MKTLTLALFALACSSSAESCPRAKVAEVQAVFEPESNGCNLPSYAPTDLGCFTVINTWTDNADCEHSASFLCANGINMLVHYDADWKTGRIVYTDRDRTCETVVNFHI